MVKISNAKPLNNVMDIQTDQTKPVDLNNNKLYWKRNQTKTKILTELLVEIFRSACCCKK